MPMRSVRLTAIEVEAREFERDVEGCIRARGKHSDLCERHARLLWPHQIIRGVFYACREEANDLAFVLAVFDALAGSSPEGGT